MSISTTKKKKKGREKETFPSHPFSRYSSFFAAAAVSTERALAKVKSTTYLEDFSGSAHARASCYESVHKIEWTKMQRTN